MNAGCAELLLGNPGSRRGNEPSDDEEGEACECDCDHFLAPSAELLDLRPSMSEVYVGSRRESVARGSCVGDTPVA